MTPYETRAKVRPSFSEQQDSFDYRFIAQELVALHPGALAHIDEPLLIRFGEPLNSWWTVDSFAVDLSGPVWRAGQIGDHVIERWARFPDRWWRRAALVSTGLKNPRR